jgi:hypothetical protein
MSCIAIRYCLLRQQLAVLAQKADALEYELPSDLSDDEEIDEDMAFTEEDKKQYAGMFANNASDDANDGGDGSDGSGLLMDADTSEDEGFNADVSAVVNKCKPFVVCHICFLKRAPQCTRLHLMAL